MRHVLLLAVGLLLAVRLAAQEIPLLDATLAEQPSLAELRRAAIDAFLGPDSFDDTARLTLADRLDEDTLSAPCRSAGAVRTAALQQFTGVGFTEVSGNMKYPDNACVSCACSSRPSGSTCCCSTTASRANPRSNSKHPSHSGARTTDRG